MPYFNSILDDFKSKIRFFQKEKNLQSTILWQIKQNPCFLFLFFTWTIRCIQVSFTYSFSLLRIPNKLSGPVLPQHQLTENAFSHFLVLEIWPVLPATTAPPRSPLKPLRGYRQCRQHVHGSLRHRTPSALLPSSRYTRITEQSKTRVNT